MTDSFKKLIEVAFDIKVFLGVASYTLYQYKDGSFVEFHVNKITNPRGLLELAKGSDIRFYGSENGIMIRVEEDPVDLT
jgi:hypothetical protein